MAITLVAGPKAPKRLLGALALIWGAGMALGQGAAGAEAGAAEAEIGAGRERPDVLLIVIDDLNDWVGHLGGHPGARTPELDRLAERGISFTNAHAAAPVCNPSRAAMLGGLRPSAKSAKRSLGWEQALAGIVTLPEHFQAHGYTLAGTGKIFHGKVEEVFEDYHRPVFAESILRPDEPYVDFGPGTSNDDGFDWKAMPVPDDEMPDYRRTSWIGAQLERDTDQPLFLAIGYHLPHIPWYVPEPYFDMHPLEGIALPEVRADDLADVPPVARRLVGKQVHANIEASGHWPEAVQAYLAASSFVDAQIGRLLAMLDASPRANRTIVMVVSDHGWHLGGKLHWRKQTLWEEATHVPYLILPPNYEHPGTLSPRAVDTLSIYPTLCGLTGVPAPEHLEGVDLTPLIRDPELAWEVGALTTLRGKHHALRTEHWRFIRYADGSEELYDHRVDPHEFDNLANEAEHRGTLVGLRARMRALLDD